MTIECEYNQYFSEDDESCLNYTSANEKMAGKLGIQGEIDPGNTAWLIAATALVMVMTPGLAFFYAGLAGQSTASNTIMMSLVSMALVSVQWLLFGYSLAFGPGGPGIGSFEWGAFLNVGLAPSGAYATTVPHVIFAAFQCMFAQITPALISGAVVGRMKFSSYCLFVLLWTTFIYDPLAHWVWAFDIDPETYEPRASGWIGVMGAIDFAGGLVIHISSGCSALAAVLVLGKRHNAGEKLKPHNVPLVVLGASFLWFGWFGFNAGSAVAADGIAANAFITTHFATAVGFLTWIVLEAIFDKKASATGAATGAVAGLVCITPACGFVTPWASFFFGFFAALAVFGAIRLKERLEFDDTLDAFSCHGVGGIVGAFLTGLFADPSINFATGAFYGNPILLGYQVASIVVAMAYSFIGTAIILTLLKYTIGIRVDPEVEEAGLDGSLHGGNSYHNGGEKKDLKPV